MHYKSFKRGRLDVNTIEKALVKFAFFLTVFFVCLAGFVATHLLWLVVGGCAVCCIGILLTLGWDLRHK
jgi:hypothetical protein